MEAFKRKSFVIPSGKRVAAALVLLLCAVIAALVFDPRTAVVGAARQAGAEKTSERTSERTYLGFDANEYPGNDALPALRKTFAFSGYWLNAPPGAKANSWIGKREVLVKNGFGFLVLFNGRLSKELQLPIDASDLGTRDAEAAVAAAQREGFSAGASTVIYLDIEEGGRMLASQISYIAGWKNGVGSKGFVAGVYCSGMKVQEGGGKTITTADDIQERAPVAAYFIYNDECPPSPGCAYLKNPPGPSRSGFAGARVWQFAQSPRRRNFTGRCAATYGADGNCYAPGAAGVLLDLDSSVSGDPSTLVLVGQREGDRQLSAAERRQAALRSLSTAAPGIQWDVETSVTGDVACDGRADQVYLGHGAGKVYVGLIRAGRETPEILEFRIGAGFQNAICDEPAKLAIEPLEYDLPQVKGFRRSNVCKGLVLSGGDCDPIHIFWNHSTQHLDWWRN